MYYFLLNSQFDNTKQNSLWIISVSVCVKQEVESNESNENDLWIWNPPYLKQKWKHLALLVLWARVFGKANEEVKQDCRMWSHFVCWFEIKVSAFVLRIKICLIGVIKNCKPIDTIRNCQKFFFFASDNRLKIYNFSRIYVRLGFSFDSWLADLKGY